MATGDHKRDPDGVSEPFEPVRCHTFITECTFGLPIYRWPDPAEVFAEIDAWWRQNASEGVQHPQRLQPGQRPSGCLWAWTAASAPSTCMVRWPT